MRGRVKVIGWLVLLVFVALVHAFGADLQTNLQGKVEEIKDPPAGIEGVVIEVLDKEGKSLKTALTDLKGAYTVVGLQRNLSVSIKMTKDGYKESPTLVDQVKLSSETVM